jgi:hypothetical protein
MSPADPKEIQRILTIIKGKLADGKLPYNSIPRVWGGPGNGEPCDACERTITTSEFIMEGIASQGGGGIQFHVQCFYLWDELRRVVTT